MIARSPLVGAGCLTLGSWLPFNFKLSTGFFMSALSPRTTVVTTSRFVNSPTPGLRLSSGFRIGALSPLNGPFSSLGRS